MTLYCPRQQRLLTITYGERTNFELMQQYGFVVPGNVENRIIMGRQPKKRTNSSHLCRLLDPESSPEHAQRCACCSMHLQSLEQATLSLHAANASQGCSILKRCARSWYNLRTEKRHIVVTCAR